MNELIQQLSRRTTWHVMRPDPEGEGYVRMSLAWYQPGGDVSLSMRLEEDGGVTAIGLNRFWESVDLAADCLAQVALSTLCDWVFGDRLAVPRSSPSHFPNREGSSTAIEKMGDDRWRVTVLDYGPTSGAVVCGSDRCTVVGVGGEWASPLDALRRLRAHLTIAELGECTGSSTRTR